LIKINIAKFNRSFKDKKVFFKFCFVTHTIFPTLVAVWNALIKFNMAQYEVDGDGFLKDPDIWNATVAETFAQEDGISELTEDHWKVIDVIREHYLENGNAPMVRKICKSTGLKLKDIYDLFPLGPARGACRVAGLPKPDGCV